MSEQLWKRLQTFEKTKKIPVPALYVILSLYTVECCRQKEKPGCMHSGKWHSNLNKKNTRRVSSRIYWNESQYVTESNRFQSKQNKFSNVDFEKQKTSLLWLYTSFFKNYIKVNHGGHFLVLFFLIESKFDYDYIYLRISISLIYTLNEVSAFTKIYRNLHKNMYTNYITLIYFRYNSPTPSLYFEAYGRIRFKILYLYDQRS